MPYPHYVIARLHEHIEPMDRGERYEDPLLARLPIGQNARVVVRPGREAARHRTVRMPRHPPSG